MAIPAALLFAQVGTSLFSAKLASDAAKQEARALEFKSEQEAVNVRLRNNARLEKLLDIVSTNNAATGARGIAPSGSPQRIMEDNFRMESRASQADLLNSRGIQLSLRARATATRRNSQIKAIGSLLGTGADIAKTGFKPKAK